MSSGLLAWSSAHLGSLGLAGLGTIAALALTVFGAPWVVARLPEDHFSRPAPSPGALGAGRLAILFARNAAALAAVLLGLIMLVLPGPGVVMLVVGLSLAEFPGKHALVMRLAGAPRVFAALNWLRRRRGRPPFVHPASPPAGARAARGRGAD